ncbi:MAG: leucyl/phenylalanyl-tRNA--protein transferase [Ectothiorhodospiraceae bacterium]|nr:leucyl/phenylalanyl-tRNA--protein transferase [Ectothiorhodospiraceae bacterium]
MRGLAPYWISPRDTTCHFPDVRLALKEPDGLLAIGGDLSPARLHAAYRLGIFPWYNDEQPILWWAPNPRSVLYPDKLNVSRSLRKTLRKKLFTVSFDQAFGDVVEACSGPRTQDAVPGTWITDDMKQAYQLLHEQGLAHSVECWFEGKLVGGLYGVAVGQVFFGESMFSRQSEASKVALVTLVEHLSRWGFNLIDCQVQSSHLDSLGAANISRETFTSLLDRYCGKPCHQGTWQVKNQPTGQKPL